ncbi:MAG: hypothetical protein BAJALOKI1v1_1730002 [Promethearchaeota archaeon]|nr:MAG: hypothetical protein BAJALOKI1v1_1730002 [Candidatus Lokiarchaeota archaeon]
MPTFKKKLGETCKPRTKSYLSTTVKASETKLLNALAKMVEKVSIKIKEDIFS